MNEETDLNILRRRRSNLTHPTTPPTQPNKAKPVTTIGQAVKAVSAVTIVYRRNHTTSVTRLDIRHAFTYLRNHARELVAQGNRRRLAGDGVRLPWLRNDMRSIEVFVQIGPTDPAVFGLEQDPARFELGDGDLVDAYVACGVEADGFARHD